MASLTEFKSNLNQGLAKSSHFMTRINLPSSLTNVDPVYSNMNKIILFCNQAQLPGISFNSNPIRTYGEVREVPYEKMYAPVSLNFYVDLKMHVKLLFDMWTNAIQDSVTRDFNWPNTYTTKLEILLYDSAHQKRYMSELHGCYPKSVQAIQLDYSSKDVMRLSVDMVYQYAVNTQVDVSSPAQSVSFSEEKIINDYDYGFKNIPSSYYADFGGFQNIMNNYDFTFEGARAAYRYFEDVGELTGYGGLFS